MLDLRQLAGGALWILGLAICLAAYSYTRWWAHQKGMRVRRAIGLALFLVPLLAGAALFCMGMALTAQRGWERVLWLVLAILCAAQDVAIWLLGRRDRRRVPDSPQQH